MKLRSSAKLISLILFSMILSLLPLQYASADFLPAYQPMGSIFSWITPSTDATNKTHGAGARLSYDGQYTTFTSNATDIIPGQTSTSGLFVRDNSTGTIQKISLTYGGNSISLSSNVNSMSENTQYFTFYAGTTWYVYDRFSSTVTAANKNGSGVTANQPIFPLSISDNGKVLYYSNATNVVVGAPSGYNQYVKDIVSGSVQLVPFSDPVGGHTWSNIGSTWSSFDKGAISADGSTVIVYEYDTTNHYTGPSPSNSPILQVLAVNLTTSVTTLISAPVSGASTDIYDWIGVTSMSRNGRYIVFNSHNHGLTTPGLNDDLYMKDVQTNTVTPVDPYYYGLSPSYNVERPTVVSDDGSTVLFTGMEGADKNYEAMTTPSSPAVYVRNMTNNTVTKILAGNTGYITYSPITGKMLLSTTTNLDPSDNVSGTSDIYERKQAISVTAVQPAATRFSWLTQGNQSVNNDQAGNFPRVSYDGRNVAFVTKAADFPGVTNDTNNAYDVYMKDTFRGTYTRLSVTGSNTEIASGVVFTNPVMSDEGHYYAFQVQNGTETEIYERSLNGVPSTLQMTPNGAGGGTPIGITSAGKLLFYRANNLYFKPFSSATASSVNFVAPTGYTTHTWTYNASTARLSADGNTLIYSGYDNTTHWVDGYGSTQINQIIALNLTTGVATLVTPTTIPATPSWYYQYYPITTSRNGRFVLFKGPYGGTSGTPGGIDGAELYMKDMQTNTLTSVDIAADHSTGGGALSTGAMVSDNGQFVGFFSNNHNLDINFSSGTTDEYSDAYVRDTVDNVTKMYMNRIAWPGDSNYLGPEYAPGYDKFEVNARDGIANGDTNDVLDVYEAAQPQY